MRSIILLMLILAVHACKSKKDQLDSHTMSPNEDSFKVTLKKGACFGTCAVFTMDIDANGLATYHGKNFTKRLGTFTKYISEDELNAVRQQFEACNFYNLPNRYNSQIADLPLVTIGAMDDDHELKSTAFKENKPIELEELYNLLHEIASNEEGWKLSVPASLDEDIPDAEKADPLTDTSELIIEPNDGVKIAFWFKENRERYGLYLIRKISPNNNFWLFSYDTELHSPEEVIELLEADKDLKSVQFNVTVEHR